MTFTCYIEQGRLRQKTQDFHGISSNIVSQPNLKQNKKDSPSLKKIITQ